MAQAKIPTAMLLAVPDSGIRDFHKIIQTKPAAISKL
jgi:hypothetical protein